MNEMAVIKLFEPYEVAHMRYNFRDACMMNGEQAILLQMFHPGDDDAVRCPQCGDSTYMSGEMLCTICYGSTFVGGVRNAMLVWSLVGDSDSPETYSKRGEWQEHQHMAQFEAFPLVREHDYIVRVTGWNADFTPVGVEGFYLLADVTQRSLRTGSRMGQTSYDVIAQKAKMTKLSPYNAGIVNYPIMGQAFTESTQIRSATWNQPQSLTVMPDVKIVTLPFETAPGGVEDVSPSSTSGNLDEGFTFTQLIPSQTWNITHNFSYDPAVTIIVNNEIVDADVDYPSSNTVVVTFGTPQAGEARLV